MEPIINKPTLAVFDFDKTMTDRHSFWRFLRYSAGAVKFYLAPFLFPKSILRYYKKKITLMEFREIAISYFYKGVSEVTFQRKANKFAEKKIPHWIVNEALAKVKEHQSRGHQVALVSNAAEEYLLPWAKVIGFDFVLGSRFEKNAGVLTGKLIGNHCYGQEKVNRLNQQIGDLKTYEIFAYGDSEGDKELLEIATHPYYRSFTQKGVYPKKIKYE